MWDLLGLSESEQEIVKRAFRCSLMTVSALITLAAFYACGWMAGWLAALSSSPVVAVVLPLIFGLISGLSGVFIDRTWASSDVLNSISVESEYLRRKLSEAIEEQHLTSYTRVAILSSTILTLCLGTYHGVNSGISNRALTYGGLLGKSTRNLHEQLKSLDPQSFAQVQRLWWYLEDAAIPNQEAVQFLEYSVLPLAVQADNTLIHKAILDENGKLVISPSELDQLVEAIVNQKSLNFGSRGRLAIENPGKEPDPMLDPLRPHQGEVSLRYQ